MLLEFTPITVKDPSAAALSPSDPCPIPPQTPATEPAPTTSDLSIPLKEIWVFSRQLALLQKTGAPLLGSLKSLAEQTENFPFAVILTSLASFIERGDSLSGALSRFPQTFPPIYRTLVREGEESGDLARSLSRAGDLLEQEHTLRCRIFSALLYPALVLVLGSVFGLVAFYVMIPFLTELFSDQSKDLPLATQLLLQVSRLLSQDHVLPLLTLALGGTGFLLHRRLQEPAHLERRDRFLLRIPVLGRLLRTACVVRILPTLSATLSAGLPLTLSLELCSEVAGNRVFQRDLLEARRKLIRGIPLEDHFAEKRSLYGPAFPGVVQVGLESGSLDIGCERLLRVLHIELDLRLEQLVTLLQPAALLLTGGVVAFLCIATLQPLANLIP